MRNGRRRCKAAGNDCGLHRSRPHIRFSGLFLAMFTGIGGVAILSYPKLSRFHLEAAVDLHTNPNQLTAANTANSLAFGQRMLHDFRGSPFGDHVVNTAGTALAELLCLAFFCRFHTVRIPGFCLVEQMDKLLHDHLVQLLRGTSKQFPLVQLQLLHEPAVLLWGQQSGFRFTARPLKTAGLQTLVQQ